MKYIILAIFALNCIIANDIKVGHKLYKEANCAKCHLDGAKFDPNTINKPGISKKANSFKALKRWIANCDAALNTGWFLDEQLKVAKYLNKTFYKFKED